jgi:hypothetical protein
LCAAFLNGHEKNLDAVAFKNLTVTASAAGQTVEKFCAPAADITTPTSRTTTTPTSVEGGKPTNPGQQGSTPAATAPGRTSDPGNSGSTPAPTAPGKSPDPGSSGSTPAATAPRTNPSPTSARGRP